MDVKQAIQTRVTTKEYLKGNEISDKDLQQIIEAAWLAPTSNNLQDSSVVILKSEKAKQAYRKAFQDFNKKIVDDASAIVLFVGTPWKMQIINDGQRIKDVDLHYYLKDPEQQQSMINFLFDYYGRKSVFADTLDISDTAIAFAFMALQATELGWQTTPMGGFHQPLIHQIALEQGDMIEGQRINMSMAIGKANPDSERNKHHIRIRQPKESMFKIK
ncbi:nitroreductase family protein [Mesoplasma lactucae]|uniref:NAD(P)H nitroreductase n=1 Tax=Mesoplasma lactucae ATCC 49193 TaxID=81460 RepID=A0A291ISX2_9MOLU|nr:nitroreductase family protein [Mesoplasma lactucae]ATG97791.1 NAD(P)H nitroreductase [Mesoplasma lactucae ATCC 49193]ATZ20431.1 NAD(P)H nitroreductase [Mesoplasma lactucae ATCC 49193]MCL8216603.1 putative NAD(P)H nitroreductase MhqN [Mesoplasma lactucae ATCC 49193]